ncbi:hypothetical protein NDU88_000206 [Pleurodeles waltl]|uniref:Uncharacterized protein n=1 Tax=Pleurodeles waltl TaxID=8319 RepID=A0AAV7LWS1_PLEWA|nr:hypothetical protein NDU88_000206 [Pleurodeles waltl]
MACADGIGRHPRPACTGLADAQGLLARDWFNFFELVYAIGSRTESFQMRLVKRLEGVLATNAAAIFKVSKSRDQAGAHGAGLRVVVDTAGRSIVNQLPVS